MVIFSLAARIEAALDEVQQLAVQAPVVALRGRLGPLVQVVWKPERDAVYARFI
jgi:hypothetical protein